MGFTPRTNSRNGYFNGMTTIPKLERQYAKMMTVNNTNKILKEALQNFKNGNRITNLTKVNANRAQFKTLVLALLTKGRSTEDIKYVLNQDNDSTIRDRLKDFLFKPHMIRLPGNREKRHKFKRYN